MNFVDGLCGRTHHHQRDCEAGDRGVFAAHVRPFESNWLSLATECERMCLTCARCNVVSFSVAERECDWFHDCDPNSLQTAAKPWKTMVVNQLQPPPERFTRNGVSMRSHSVVRWNATAVRLYIVDDWSAEWVLQESHSESMVTRVFRRLASECVGRDRVIVDVGANSGYYSLMSAALGCQVVAFEPQPGCQKRLDEAIRINAFQEAMRVVPRPVGLPPGTLLGVNPHGCSGDYQLRPGAAAQRLPLRAEHMTRFTTVQHELKDFQRPRLITLIKIDTEGAEGMALRSLLPHLGDVDNLVVETTPWRWPPVSNMSRAEVADVYASLLRPHRFVLAYVRTALGKTRWIDDAEDMRAYIGEEMPGDYWGMADLWFGRDAGLMRSVF